MAAASPRPATPSFARIHETWMLAVLGVMNSAWPICRLVGPLGDQCQHLGLTLGEAERGRLAKRGKRNPAILLS
jgi:hypothetical protein